MEVLPEGPWDAFMWMLLAEELSLETAGLRHISIPVSILTLSLSYPAPLIPIWACLQIPHCARTVLRSFSSPPVHVSSPLSRTSAAFTEPAQSPSMESCPVTPDYTGLTSSWVSIARSCRFFRAEAVLEIPGLVPCLVESKGVGKRLEEKSSPERRPSMSTHPHHETLLSAGQRE